MPVFSRVSARIRSFWTSSRGNTGIIYALAAVPVLLGAGAAIDFARYGAAQTHMQAAIDAGALAGGAMLNVADSARIAAAQAAFNAVIAKGAADSIDIDTDFKVENGVMLAHASGEMPTSFMRVAGISSMVINGEADVILASDKKAEVVLVLDYSASMSEVSGAKVKYVAMREAATSLVNDLAAANPGKVQFGLVPFSHHVYTTLPSGYVLGASGASWTGCTQDRKYPYNLTDATPGTAAATKWGQAIAPDHASWGCDGYKTNKLVVKPLTTDTASVTTQLAAMKPYAWTHIALGVEFGYHVLSPNAPYAGGASYSDTETRKFMIVLTDGMQTEPAFGPGTVRSVAQGESNLEELCNNVKASGITVITLAFDLDDSSTRKRLQKCATNATTDFFVANSDTDLTQAFENIKLAIANQVYLSK